MGRRKKEIKYCKICHKLLPKENKSGYCRHCYQSLKNKERRNRLTKEHRCLNCGKKINPIIIYPNGLDGIKIVRYPTRCWMCRLKLNKKVFKVKNI